MLSAGPQGGCGENTNGEPGVSTSGRLENFKFPQRRTNANLYLTQTVTVGHLEGKVGGSFTGTQFDLDFTVTQRQRQTRRANQTTEFHMAE